MGPLIGFVSFPRPAESLRPAGAFFFAVVESKLGPQTWRLRLEGQSLTVTSDLDFTIGQKLRLKLASQDFGRWVLQIVSPPPPTVSANIEATSLMAAFLSRGLPAAVEKLAAWTKWLDRISGPVDKEGWAASLQARGDDAQSSMATALEPWLAWQVELENGKNPPPPDEDFWDLWNSRQTIARDPWLVAVVRWTHEGAEDAGLLQAHWNPQSQSVDQWNLTASPVGTPFRLDAKTRPGSLSLTWHFFNENQQRRWETLAPELSDSLSTPDLTVKLTVAGRPAPPSGFSRGGIRVEA